MGVLDRFRKKKTEEAVIIEQAPTSRAPTFRESFREAAAIVKARGLKEYPRAARAIEILPLPQRAGRVAEYTRRAAEWVPAAAAMGKITYKGAVKIDPTALIIPAIGLVLSVLFFPTLIPAFFLLGAYSALPSESKIISKAKARKAAEEEETARKEAETEAAEEKRIREFERKKKLRELEMEQKYPYGGGAER